MEKIKNIVIAPDSFKESMSAQKAANAIEEGFMQVFPDWNYIKVPMADGGEGTVQSIVDALGGVIKKVPALDALGRKSASFYGLINNGETAIIEIAACSGLEKIEKDKRNPMITTTWGLGDLISSALADGVKEIIIGLGGSATNDGGAGMIQRLGGRLLDKDGLQIAKGGQYLKDLCTIDLSEMDPRILEVSFIGATDVNNPLTGPKGASYIYGPQKGATVEQVKELDENLKHFARVIQGELKLDVERIPATGAAGGTAAGLVSFLGAQLKQGGDLITELVGLEDKVSHADLVITGEGGLNHQTIYGKTPIVVAQIAKRYNLPVIAIVGSIMESHEAVYIEGIDTVFSILPKLSDEKQAFTEAYKNTVMTARNIAAVLKINL